MNVAQAILVAFFGNYLINTVAPALVAFIPISAAGGRFTPQYIGFIVLSAVLVGVLTWWYGARGTKAGLIFGLIGFAVSIATAFVTGIAGVLTQTASLSAVGEVLPRFFTPFLWDPNVAVWEQSTLWLLAYWVIAATLVGWYMRPKAAATSSAM
ncbi:hypothetical protein A3C18_03270 [Candidatus Kaiserbacteria bacterium RIFCSPHIGHO2_02_FULL_54_11b]|uniref:ABC-2 type transporter domain-containing protein n=2 Tax=Candidatus Kaiseribacteriota TaxID=1752734 RepID=A0A1F6CQ23_9BACT|nr:MAG: hypothetical protein A2704_02140 [Candidatus Kaiserbacteria bacterium RIFCSPHIGHO2_01_FULL_54_36b]OGG64492.1 MAG: hypothetical protein A3C18_03270 [Candidatus Kaiserbacteria bacterium RIFCSPHIGHO2_02_FULL_54_11b]